MGDLFWNKVAGALLVLILGVIAIKELGHMLVHASPSEQLAYPVDLSVIGASATGGEEEEEAGPVDYGLLLASANVSAGERFMANCTSCHTLEQGGANGTGPNLWNVVNREKAGHAGFNYSSALSGMGGSWGYAELDGFLTRPAVYARGTSMSYRGIRDEAQRMDVIAYLRTLSDDPAPLPDQLSPASPASE